MTVFSKLNTESLMPANDPANYGSLSVEVINKSTLKPISGFELEILGEKGNFVCTEYTNAQGKCSIRLPAGTYTIVYLDFSGLEKKEVTIEPEKDTELIIAVEQEEKTPKPISDLHANIDEEDHVYQETAKSVVSDEFGGFSSYRRSPGVRASVAFPSHRFPQPSPDDEPGKSFTSDDFNTEDYGKIIENPFQRADDNPVSTFSVDVDTASYSNVRRYLRQMELPPKDAVRLEEFINYFDYEYPQPAGEHPVALHTELAPCPWQSQHHLLSVGIQGKKLGMEELPPSHLTFLIDVSGSMRSAAKLPLVKRALGVLVDRLREEDRISIVTYCHEIQTVLQGVSGADKERISSAIEQLRAYGGTAGGPALKKAYELAAAHLVHNGNNRILLCTDGDFNLGFSSDAEMVELVEQERDKGVYLSAFGFGMGNYKDQKLSEIAKHGNGNYAYIDTILEAKRIFGEALAGTLFTVADNAKIQLEFNPAKVAGYRLLGYEKRLLRREDFNDDSKDAAEIGAGQRVTALYEIVPAGVEMPQAVEADPLKYQQRAETTAGASEEWLTLKFRYIPPQSGESSRLLEQTVSTDELQEEGSANFRLAAAAAGFGMLLRDSEHKGDLTWKTLQQLADSTVQQDPHGYRKELCVLIRNAGQL